MENSTRISSSACSVFFILRNQFCRSVFNIWWVIVISIRQNQSLGKDHECQRCISNDSSHRDILHILVLSLSDILR